MFGRARRAARPEPPSRWSDRQLLGTIARSVWQWQLVVAFSVVAAAMAVALFADRLFGDSAFTAGLILISVVTAITLVMPWARTARWTLAPPLLDTVAIGLLAIAEPTLGFLWVIPIAWIATYYSPAAIVGTLVLVVVLQLTRWWLPGRADTQPLDVLLVLLSLGFLGVATAQGARRTRAFRHLIRRQSRQLDRVLHRATQHEMRSQALFDSITTALARVDADGRIDLVNAAYRSLYAYDDSDLRHPARAVEYSGYRGAALPREATSVARAARGERVDGELIWIYDGDGRWRALTLSIRGRAGNGSRQDAAIIELDDVTAIETARLEQRSAMSAVSHELRNPLTVILGHADLLLDAPGLTRAQEEHATLIQSAAERMLKLTSSLLDAGRGHEVAAGYDLDEITTAAAESFAPAASAADIDLTLHRCGPVTVNGDGFRVRQVIDNLIGNALKYTPRGGTVRVELRRDGDEAVLTVADSGIGMSAADLERVFTPYFRAETATATGIPGTGLGMSIAARIVEEAHGTITLDSAIGSGTTVTVRLPCTSPAAGRGDE